MKFGLVVETSGPLCVQPAVPIAGYVTEYGPEPASASASLSVKLPSTLPL